MRTMGEFKVSTEPTQKSPNIRGIVLSFGLLEDGKAFVSRLAYVTPLPNWSFQTKALSQAQKEDAPTA